MNVGCVVMASGEGRRFGGDKLLADFGGRPMLGCLLDALPRGLQTVVVTRSPAVQALARRHGFACVLHSLPEVCDTIRLGLEALPPVDGCLFCVGDQPLLARATLERMLAAFEEAPEHIVRAAYGSRPGNPVLFPKSLFGELKALHPGQTGGAVLRLHRERVLAVQAGDAMELEDVDTLEALARLLTKAKER